MLDSLSASLTVASSGLEAQSTRMRIVSENLANATSTLRYVTDKPDPAGLAEDREFEEMSLGLDAGSIEVRPASELFER